MLKITIKARLKCPRHPAFDPEKTREGGIKANCSTCWQVHDAYMKAVALREFIAKVEQLTGQSSS